MGWVKQTSSLSNSFRQNEYPILFLIFIFVVIYFWSCFFSQKIPIANGAGWDGAIYAHLVKIFPNYLHNISDYHSHRILPSLLIGMFLKIFDIAPTDANIIRAFEFLNFIIILFAIELWWLFVKKNNVSASWKCISFSGLFINYAILKHAGYYPVLTDTVAFSFGIAIFYFYFMRQQYFVLLFSILGSFTFPTFNLLGIFLLLIPYKKESCDNLNTSLQHSILPFLFAFFFATLCLMYFIFRDFSSYFIQTSFSSVSSTALLMIQLPRVANIVYLPFSLHVGLVFIMFFYLYFGSRYLLSYALIINIFRNVSLISFLQSCFFCIVNLIVFSLLKDKAVGPITANGYLFLIMQEFTALPLINLVAAFVYYGPFLIFLILLWEKICIYGTRIAIGCMLPLLLCLTLSLASESRHFINFMGMLNFLVLLTIGNTEYKQFSNLMGYFFIFASFLFSKLWFYIKMPLNEPMPAEAYLSSSWQDYFMSFGPNMSLQSYFLQSGLFFVSVIVLWALIKKDLKRMIYPSLWTGNNDRCS